jgi:RHS repeat-associated protein
MKNYKQKAGMYLSLISIWILAAISGFSQIPTPTPVQYPDVPNDGHDLCAYLGQPPCPMVAKDDFFILRRPVGDLFEQGLNDERVGFVYLTSQTGRMGFMRESSRYSGGTISQREVVAYNDSITENQIPPVYGVETGTYYGLHHATAIAKTFVSNLATINILVIPYDGAENAGYFCPVVGQPVNVTNGNMWVQQTDYDLPGVGEKLEITRFYNSIIQTSGRFGFGWSTKYDESLAFYNNLVRLNMSDGRAAYFFRQNSSSNHFTAATIRDYMNLDRNPDNTYDVTFKDGSIHHFNSAGRLLWQRDRDGNQTTLNYNNYVLSSVTDPTGRTLTFNVNSFGLVESISDPLGTIATYTYETGSSKLTEVTYPDGSQYKFEYQNLNQKVLLKTVKDAYNNILETHEYDSEARAITSEKQGGIEKYTFDYTSWNSVYPFTKYTLVKHKKNASDTNFVETKYYYGDGYGNSQGSNLITRIQGNCNCGSGTESTNFVYDGKGNVTKMTDALGKITNYTYDHNGNRLSMTDILGTETYTYNSFGEVLTRTDRMAGVTTNTYDPNGNLLTTKDALDNTTTLTYTPLGQLKTVKDARNSTTTLNYDTQGRLTQVKDANNKTTNYGYDARARLTSMTNAVNQTTNLEYDLNNRLKKVTHPDTTFMSYVYDLAGRRTAMIDERSNTTTFGFDGAYRLTTINDALNHTMTYGYDLMSNLTSQTDALGNTTNYQYDDFNRLKKAIYPPSFSGTARLDESLTYDAIGNVKTRTDTAGRVTYYDYDTAHRLKKTTDALSQITQFDYNARSQIVKVTDALNQVYDFAYDPVGRQLSQTRAGTTMSFEYDAVGNRTKRTDYIGRETSYEYDLLNRLKKINYLSANNPVPNLSATYNYDDLSRLVSAANESGTVNFTYDTRGRIKTSTDVFNHLVEYNYDGASNRTQLKLDGNIHTTYAYDIANRLTTLTDEASQNFTFAYDIADRLISKLAPNGINTTYDYDGMSRLTRLKHQSSTATLTDNQYAYNPANQISQITELAQTKNFGYDLVDRLTSMNNGTLNESYNFDGVGNRTSSHLSSGYNYQPYNRVTSTQTASYVYDSNGNMMSKSEGKKRFQYFWDYENRMTQASDKKNRIRYRYDALGRRIQRYFVGGKENTKFIYDGLDVVADDNSGVLTKYQNGLGIDNKLKMITSGTAKYFLADHLGSTTALTDASGNVSSSASYDSFGNPTNNLTTRYGYTAREFDNFTGLHYYRARFYDAKLGRFISEDPIGFAGGDINLFGYVWNNPIKYSDPTGLDGWGNDTAGWLDDRIEFARKWWQGDDQDWVWNGSVNTGADLAFGASDMMRVGNGAGQAFCDCDENIYGRAAFLAMDVQRASGLFTLLGGIGARVRASSCSARTGNPFKGKSPQQVEDMFLKKGFDPKGPDPLNGRGTYVNPKSGRGYHINADHPPPKPPHVGVHRPRTLRNKMKAKDFDF